MKEILEHTVSIFLSSSVIGFIMFLLGRYLNNNEKRFEKLEEILKMLTESKIIHQENIKELRQDVNELKLKFN